MQRSAALVRCQLVILLSHITLIQLGMMGTSVLYSSGDYGVAGNGGVCLDGPGGLPISI